MAYGPEFGQQIFMDNIYGAPEKKIIDNENKQEYNIHLEWSIDQDDQQLFFDELKKESEGQMWDLRCCPNGHIEHGHETNKGYVELYLVCKLPSNIKSLKVYFTLKCRLLSKTINEGFHESKNATFTRNESCHGFYNFCQTKQLQGYAATRGSKFFQDWDYTGFSKSIYGSKQQYEYIIFVCDIAVLECTTIDNRTMSFTQWKKLEHNNLRSLLEYNNLYNELYDILLKNELDFEVLKNDIEEKDLNDSVFNEFGIE
eukprot:327982_1